MGRQNIYKRVEPVAGRLRIQKVPRHHHHTGTVWPPEIRNLLMMQGNI